MKKPLDPTRCCEIVVTYRNGWSDSHQCKRKQHDPEAVKARDADLRDFVEGIEDPVLRRFAEDKLSRALKEKQP